jgi:hypothetical protein
MGIEMPPEWTDPALTEPQHFEVWPENWEAVLLFVRCQTQWHWRPDGQRSGLIYSELLAMGNLYQIDSLSQVVEDVQVIEAEILIQGAQR